jgi:hypothetical protein
MRNFAIGLTGLAVVLYCFGTARAQSKSDEVIANIEQAMKEMEPEWRCSSVSTPQGEPGPDSPRGTKYLFRCQRKTVELTIFMLYGEAKRDAERALALSQRLQINESKPVEGIGEQAYQLAKERFAWITFRKAKVYAQVNVATRNASQSDGPSATKPNDLIEAARLFAKLVAHHIPAT